MFNCSDLFLLQKSPNCQITKNGKLVDPDDVTLTEQVLIVPPCTLDYGKYVVHLEVQYLKK